MEVARDDGSEKTPISDALSLSDQELIDRTCSGCQEAATTLLVRRYGALMQFFARKYDDDMISDLYLHLFSNGTWARLRKWDGRSKFSTWLAAVARNLYAERVRTRSREADNLRKYALSFHRLLEGDRAERDQPMVAMADQEVQTFQNSRILRAMELLSDRDRLIVSLLDLKVPPEKIEVVAEMLDRTIEAVRVAHTRAKQRLREVLEREGEVR